MTNNNGEIGSPCLTPLLLLYYNRVCHASARGAAGPHMLASRWLGRPAGQVLPRHMHRRSSVVLLRQPGWHEQTGWGRK